jgi:hypothetical protein
VRPFVIVTSFKKASAPGPGAVWVREQDSNQSEHSKSRVFGY